MNLHINKIPRKKSDLPQFHHPSTLPHKQIGNDQNEYSYTPSVDQLPWSNLGCQTFSYFDDRYKRKVLSLHFL